MNNELPASQIGQPATPLTLLVDGIGDQARLSRVLAPMRLLLVLDNFEQVVAAAPLLSELLARCPELTLLVTSRMRLRLSGEREFPVGPLMLPGAGAWQERNRGDPVDAVHLFVERAQAVRPSFSLERDSPRWSPIQWRAGPP